jgi:hypothetical protein
MAIMNWLKVLVMFAVLAAIHGCSDKSEAVVEKKYTPTESIRMALENVAKTGQSGSELGAMMGDIDKLKETNPQLGESLSADGMKMMSTSDPAQLKAMANDMLKKLDAAGSRRM